MSETETTASNQPAAPIVMFNDKPYMSDAKGKFVPLELIKPVDRLMDDTVRDVVRYAEELSARIARFKAHTFSDIGAFQALIAEKYNASVGGMKGNISLLSFDGCMRVQVQVSDLFEFGPELQVAKSLIDDCLRDWSDDSRSELRALITRVFNVDKEGTINRTELFALQRVEITDERWVRAMDAIRASINVIGSKSYVRIHKRSAPDAKWEPVSIDMASV